jgi:DNA-binding response OmpR family regulator
MAEAEATVLVVDDDAGFRAYVRAALERPGFRVVEASTGAEALDAALRERPHAILLDWRMPGQSGITTCRQLREEADLAGVRIAMVTGLDDERDRTLARHAGADAFLVKDPDPHALTVQVRRLLAPDGARAPAPGGAPAPG